MHGSSTSNRRAASLPSDIASWSPGRGLGSTSAFVRSAGDARDSARPPHDASRGCAEGPPDGGPFAVKALFPGHLATLSPMFSIDNSLRAVSRRDGGAWLHARAHHDMRSSVCPFLGSDAERAVSRRPSRLPLQPTPTSRPNL